MTKCILHVQIYALEIVLTKSLDKLKADAILVAIPEYNYSVSGVLKNAIDFASRPYGDNPFDDKPVAIISASIGMLGGAREIPFTSDVCVLEYAPS